MTTFSREAWQEAEQAWTDGEFGDAWEAFRIEARTRGFIYPPTGTKWDSWEDDDPSQRAVLWRAIEETPRLLLTCIRRSRSWHDVVRLLTAARDELRARRPEPEVHEGQSRAEAIESLGEIMRRTTGVG